ncbi:AMIN-like domain-containing (lipo)protein [Blastococcus sp. SYSU D00813]
MSRPRILRVLGALVGAAALSLTLLTGTASAAPFCGQVWGSTPEHSDHHDRERLLDVRSGQHACFDRLVLDLGGEDATFGSYDVRYVSSVSMDGSGTPVPVRGGAVLQVVVHAPAHDDEGRPTYSPGNPRELVAVGGYATFRQVAWAGSFEGQTTLALGVRARLPFRVFALAGTPDSDHTPRLVIDVAHRW